MEDDDHRLVIARRTWSCDQTVAAFTAQMRLLPEHVSDAYISQLTAPHRITDTTRSGQKVGRYVSERADHYFFAETYDQLARKVRGGQAFGLWGPPAVRNRWDPP